MPWYCSLCSNPEEYCYISRFCSKCKRLKKIIELYSIDRVNRSLETIFIRDGIPIENRTHAIAKTERGDKIITRSNSNPKKI